MTKKELAQVLEILIEKARRAAETCRRDGHATDEAYQRGKLDAYEIIHHNLNS